MRCGGGAHKVNASDVYGSAFLCINIYYIYIYVLTLLFIDKLRPVSSTCLLEQPLWFVNRPLIYCCTDT